MKNYFKILFLILSLIFSASLVSQKVNAFSLKNQPVSAKHTYSVECGNYSCTANVYLDQGTDKFAPENYEWQYKINNPKGSYNGGFKAGSLFSFTFPRKTSQHFHLQVRTSQNGKIIADSQYTFAINDFLGAIKK